VGAALPEVTISLLTSYAHTLLTTNCSLPLHYTLPLHTASYATTTPCFLVCHYTQLTTSTHSAYFGLGLGLANPNSNPNLTRLGALEDTLGRASSLAAKLAGPHSRAVVAMLLASPDEVPLLLLLSANYYLVRTTYYLLLTTYYLLLTTAR